VSVDRQQRLFDACMDAASDEERERLLEACGDLELQEQVRELLRVHADAGDSLSLAYAMPEFPRMASPHQVGVYRILERVGEGAIGEVFLAEQQAPVRRRVALKILKFGLSTREVIGRFELERQALAVLTHPNIARIFDAGTTADGRPYFAMEYVPGIPVTRYADERRLDIRGRLALFAQVCSGVQHAHLRGIIHRDLKPSNILVTEMDGAPVPKIIDFGIAKATTTSAGDGDVYTRHGHLLGTPDYMSPEQAQLSPLDVDARTDVYSLGILLFELLTGSRPYNVTRDALNPAVVLNEIMSCETRRPSEVLAAASSGNVAHAERCRTTPAALAGRLRGDLDWIVLKALEKDRQRRYDSPAALAADLRRHADDEPVLAGPPSALYRIGKFARRHRLAVGMMSTAFAAALLFGSAMAWFALDAAAERDRANQEARVARRVTAFAAGIFELANPALTGSSDVSARALLDSGVRRLLVQGEAQGPEMRAALLEAAGKAYRGLGAYDEAASLLDAAVAIRAERRDEDPAAYAEALLSQALLKRDQGDLERATAVARDAERVLQAAGGPQSDALHRARLDLAEILRRRTELDEAAALAERTLAATPSATGERVAVRARALMVLGRVRAAQGKLPEAERLLRESLDMYVEQEGPLGEMTLEAKNGLADTLVIMGQPSRAEPLFRELVEDVRRVYGEEHAEMGIVLNNLGNALSDIPEKYAEAGEVYLAAAAITRRTRGELHPETATTYNNLGALYLKTREWAKADEAFRQAIAIRTSAFGADHPHTAQALRSRAEALGRLGRLSEAEQLLRASVAAYEGSLGHEHWRTANAQLYLGWIFGLEGHPAEATRSMNEAYPRLVQALGQDHPRVLAAKDLMLEAGVAGVSFTAR
jgi:eukaryotic-like serine/threonine-protein kinase